MTANPFKPPGTDFEARAESAAGFARLRWILRSWERLRLYYNGGWLVILTLLASAGAVARDAPIAPLAAVAVFGALVANAAFFLGPIGEAYLYVLGVEHPAVRFVFFFGGTALATLLALASLLAVSFAAMIQID